MNSLPYIVASYFKSANPLVPHISGLIPKVVALNSYAECLYATRICCSESKTTTNKLSGFSRTEFTAAYYLDVMAITFLVDFNSIRAEFVVLASFCNIFCRTENIRPYQISKRKAYFCFAAMLRSF